MSEDKRPPRLLTVREVAALLRYTPQHIYRLEREGKIPRRRQIGESRVAFIEAEITAWIESRPLAPLPEPADLD